MAFFLGALASRYENPKLKVFMFKTIIRKILLWMDRCRESDQHVCKGVRLIGGGGPTVTVGDFTYINDAKLYCWKAGFN